MLKFNNYWRLTYWNRYDRRFDNSDQPDKRKFKKAINSLEKWLGQKYSDRGIKQNYLVELAGNLAPWSGYCFLWVTDFLSEIKLENEKVFQNILAKFQSSEFSFEAYEILKELFLLKRIVNLSEIELDPKFETGENPDILIQSKEFGRIIIEITRLEESEEDRFSAECFNKISSKFNGNINWIHFAFKFLRRPQKHELEQLLILIDDGISSPKGKIIIKTDYVILVSESMEKYSDEGFSNLCKLNALAFNERSGWIRFDKTADRIPIKITKKNKYSKKFDQYILSLYGIEKLFYFWNKDDIEDTLVKIASKFQYPVKFNYETLFYEENWIRDFKRFRKTSFELGYNRLSNFTFTLDKNYESPLNEFTIKLLQNFG